MFHGCKGSILISDVPKLDGPIIRSREEEVIYALIEFHLGNPFFVTLILLLEGLFALTRADVPEADSRIFMPCNKSCLL